MPLSFASHALVDATALSRFIWGVDDATAPAVGLTAQQIFSVELAVNAISRQIMRHVSSEIKEATYTEVWDGAGSDELVPRERPISAVSSVKFAANGDFASAQALPSEAVYFDTCSIKFRAIRTPIGRGLVQVVYTAGYATVPEDIQMAALLQFQWNYRQIGKGDAMVGLKTIAKGQESQTKDDTIKNFGLRAEVVGLLKTYERMEAPASIMFTRVS